MIRPRPTQRRALLLRALVAALVAALALTGCASGGARPASSDGDLTEDLLAKTCPNDLHLIVDIRQRVKVRVLEVSAAGGTAVVGDVNGPGSWTFPLRYRQNAVYHALSMDDGRVIGTSSRQRSRTTDTVTLVRQCLKEEPPPAP